MSLPLFDPDPSKLNSLADLSPFSFSPLSKVTVVGFGAVAFFLKYLDSSKHVYTYYMVCKKKEEGKGSSANLVLPFRFPLQHQQRLCLWSQGRAQHPEERGEPCYADTLRSILIVIADRSFYALSSPHSPLIVRLVRLLLLRES